MSQIPDNHSKVVSAVGCRLYLRHHLWERFPRTCSKPNLSPIEYVFLSVNRFYQNIYINGWDGYLYNTDFEFGGFLPVALSAIGAHEFAALACDARRQDAFFSMRTPEANEKAGIKPASDSPFFECREDLGELLYEYWLAHRNEFPSAEAVSDEEAKDYKNEEEYLDRQEYEKKPRRICGRCANIYHAEADNGECALCRMRRALGLE